MKTLLLPLLALAAAHAAPPARVVALGGPVTETVFALGAGDRVVAVDLSSTYPAAAAALPKVGYHRALSAEGVLSLRPDLVIGTDDAGPPATLQQLQAAKTPVVFVPSENSVEGAKEKILAVSRIFGLEEKGRALNAELEKDLETARRHAARAKGTPRVLFIYARGQGTLSVSGRNTAAAAMIALAGGENAVTGYEGYKPLTSEALAAARPDVILLTHGGMRSLGGAEGLLKQPGVALTPAGKARAFAALDDELLLGFGPRLGHGVLQLARALHPEIR